MILDQIKKLLKHTAIYSVGTIAPKIVGFLLLPLYTSYLTVSDYGVLGLIEITITVFLQTFVLGQTQSIVRFYNDKRFISTKKENYFTHLIFISAVGLLLFLSIFLSADYLSGFYKTNLDFSLYIKLSAVILFFRLHNRIILGHLRATERSVLFSLSNILKITVSLILNIILIAVYKMGITGILISTIIGEVLQFTVTIIYELKYLKIGFNKELFRESISYGFPLIFSNLASILLNLGDRYLIKLLGNYHDVGLYNLGYKISSILQMLFINSFQLSMLPVVYKIYGQKNDLQFFKKMFTYFMLCLVWAGLFLSVFSRDMIRIFAQNSDFWPAYKVIPIIILGMFFLGAKQTFTISLLIKNKTSIVAYLTVIAAVFNIGLNILLIPQYGIFGAAYATLAAFILLAIASYFYGRKYLYIPWEIRKFWTLIVMAVAFYIVIQYLFSEFSTLNILLKFLIAIIFPLALYLVKFYEKYEVRRIINSIKKWRNPGSWKGIIMDVSNKNIQNKDLNNDNGSDDE